MKILGLDPGLRHTGWGLVEADGPRLRYLASGIIHSAQVDELATRLAALFRGIDDVLRAHRPDEAAVEETFVNRNPTSTLKLGLARGVVMLAPALAGLPVAEYAPNRIKKAVVGVGHASKGQVEHMVARLLPDAGEVKRDAADALAVAICHAHYGALRRVAGEAASRPTATAKRRSPQANLAGAAAAGLAEELARAVFRTQP